MMPFHESPSVSLVRFSTRLPSGLLWEGKFSIVSAGDKAMSLNSEQAALRLVVEGTVSETGVEFFRALVKNLATVMGTVGAWVTEYLPEQQRLRAHAFWL